jgi:capsid protein
VFEAWITHKLRRGDINLPLAKIEKFKSARFIARRWSWVDPAKDIAANVDAINNGLKTRGDIIAENYGGSIQDFYARFAREEEARKAAGIEFDEKGVMRG